MTLENLITALNSKTSDLEIKINSLINFYYKSYSQEHALSIANLHDNHQIDLLHLAKKIIECKTPKQLKNIDQFEHVFFNIITQANNINFIDLTTITFQFDEIFDKDPLRFHYLKKVGQKNSSYAQYLFSLITNNLEKHYDQLGLAIACLTNFEPNQTQEFILKHFDLKEKNINLFLDAIKYMIYPLPSDATQILDKILNLIDHNNLNGNQFSKILEIITYMYLQHKELEEDIINTIKIIKSNPDLVEIPIQSSTLLLSEGNKFSKKIRESFYKIILNSHNIPPQVCNSLSLCINNITNENDIKRLIEITEHLLINHENISIKNFHTYYICEKTELINKIITRWLLTKQKKLWESVSTIILTHQIKSLEVDVSWVTSFKESDYTFLTKKSIGWFDIYENLILIFITSILNKMQSSQLIKQVLNLTFQHVIINYEPQYIGFFFNEKNYMNLEIKEKIQDLKIKHEKFYSDLDRAKNLKELACPLEHSRLLQYKRHYENEKISKLADAQSVFSDIFSRNIMLYGETYIHLTNIENNEISIQENELSSFSYTMTLPLKYFTDPVLLEYQRQIMKYEGMES